MRAHLAGIVAGFLGGGAAVALGACLLPDITVGETEPEIDAGTDVVVDVGPDVAPPCERTTYPPYPTEAPDGVSGPDIVLALHQIDFGDLSPEIPGFDLDFTCTCYEDAGDSCATGLKKPLCDAPGGVDNAASKLFKLVTQSLGEGSFGSEFYSTRADLGFWSLLFQISGYNGLPDDPAVTVSIFVSPGAVADTLAWDGTDAWRISSDCLGPSGLLTDPLYVSKGAYVAGGVLVASLSSVAMRLSGSMDTIRLGLSGGVLSGKLVFNDGAHLENGTLAARWSEKEVFATLASFRGQGGQLICKDNQIAYNSVKARICGGLDIASDAIQPGSTPCDALSFGMGLRADEAMLGPVEPAAPETPGCPPDQDPTTDSCPK